MANSNKAEAPQGALDRMDKRPENETVFHTIPLDEVPKGIDGVNPVSANNPAAALVNDPVEREAFLKDERKLNTELGVVEGKDYTDENTTTTTHSEVKTSMPDPKEEKK